MKKKWRRFIIGFFCCILTFFLFNYGYIIVKAYVKNGWVLSNPSNVKYKIGTTMGNYTADIIASTKSWETHCPEIGVSQVGVGENIYFYGDLSVDTGNYATCFYHSNDNHTITFYKLFLDLTPVRKNETIVHEVGHALGLAHCEKSKESISVMRAKGFNNVGYPLPDDKDGIAAIY